MGQYIGRNKLGTPALFIIKGDTPDPGEMAKITDILSGKPVQADTPAPAPEEEPGILENIKGNALRGWNETQAGVDFAMQGLKEAQGDKAGAKEWEDAAHDQLAERDTYKVREKGFLEEEGIYNKIASLTGTAARTGIGMAGGIGATLAGGAIGTAVGGPVGAVVGTGLGLAAGTAAYAPQMMSANAERQIEEHGYIKDFGKAFKATALQAGVESITDKITLKLAGVAYKGAKSAAKAAGFGGRAVTDPAIHEAVDKSIKIAMTEAAKRIGAPAAFGAVSGAAEEVMQQQLERWQAELPLMDADAKKEYLESAIVGGILEGVFGAGAGYVGHRQDSKTIKRLKAAAADVESENAARIQRATGSAAEHERLRQSRYEEPPPPPETEEQVRIAGLLPKPTGETREQIALRNLPPGLNEDETGSPPPPPSGPSFTHPLPEGFPAFEGERSLKNRSFMKSLTGYGRALRDRGTPPRPDEFRTEAVAIMRDTHEAERAAKVRKPEPGVQGPSKPIYSETEYTETIDKLRDFKSLSVDRIATEMKMPRPKAQAVFTEMLRRNDAYPSGSENQYAKITTPHGIPTRSGSDVRGKIQPKRSRDFIVKPVQRADKTPFGVEVAGKARKPRFTTREEAEAWIAKTIPKSKQAQVVEDQSGQQFGIHELHYQTQSNGEQHLVGERVVNTFQTREEADAAVKDYDPAYSPETNQRRTRVPVEEKESAIAADTLAELGPIEHQLQNAVNATVGAGRAQVDLVPKITRDYLRKLFPDVHDSRIPGEDAVVEGLHHTDPRALIKNVITLGADLNSPNLTEEQRTQLIQEVLNHELIHLIRSLNLLTNQEWNQLYKAALNQNIPGKQYTWAERAFIMQGPKSSTNVVMEEAVAEMFRTYIKDPTAFRNPERGILKKIADLIKKLIGLGRRHDAEDLMDMISNGGIADREIGHGGSRPGHEQEDIFYSLLKPDNFYLDTTRFLDKVTLETAPKNQWIKMLSQAGIKPEELNWLDIKQWLQDLPKGELVHKNDIANYVKASGPKVVPVIFAKQAHPDLGDAAVMDPRWEGKSQAPRNDKTYAEVAFTFPAKPGEPNFTDERGHMIEPTTKRGEMHRKLENVLAFARFRDVVERVNGEDKRILFLEELQSDLHQKGSMNGYFSKSFAKRIDDMREEARLAYDEIRRLKSEQIKVADEIWKLGQMEKQHLAGTQGLENVPEIQETLTGIREARTAKIRELAAMPAQQDAAAAAHRLALNQMNEMKARQYIPNAPFKSNWEDYVIRRMIRHAAEHGYDGIAWHGSAESVSATEGHGDLEKITDERGKDQYMAYGSTPVGPIVNRYLIKLPKITRGIGQGFGVELEHQVFGNGKRRREPWMENIEIGQPINDYRLEHTFPDKAMLHTTINQLASSHNYMKRNGEFLNDDDEYLANHLITKLKRAQQIAYNRRVFDVHLIFDDADLSSSEIDHILSWSENNDFYAIDAPAEAGDMGGFAHDNYRMMFNQTMKGSFERGEQPFFSMVRQRKQEIEADPKFQQWFNGSVVTEDDDSPKVVYHYTKSDEPFGRFNRLSHFGSARTANDLYRQRNPQIIGTPETRAEIAKNSRMYPVFLNLRRPLHIIDDGFNHNATNYAYAAANEGALTRKQQQEITDIARGPRDGPVLPPRGDEQAALSRFVELLEKNGYDGLVYQNQREGEGETSYVTFRPAQIKSIFNRGTWDASNPDIDYSVLEPPKYSATAPLGQRVPPNPPIDRLSEMHNRMTYDNLAPQIHKIFAMLPGEQREAAKSFTDTSIINMQDRMLSIGRIIDQLKKNGGVITTENDTYLRQTLFASQTDAHLTANEKAFYQPLENAIKGLSVTQADYNALITHFGADSPVGKILKTYPKTPKFALAELYLYAQHAQERNAEMRRRNAVWQRDGRGQIVRDPQGNPVPVRPLAYEEGSGMSDPLAQQVLNWFNGTPARMREFSDLTNQNSVRSRMRALITSTNDVRVEGGLNPDFRPMRYTDGSRVDPYDDYVPLRGMIAEAHDDHDEVTQSFAKTGRGFNIRGKEDYAAVGREEHLARDIISTAMMQNQEAIVRAGKNKVGQSFLKLIQSNPTEMARVAEIMQIPKTKYVYDRKLGKVVQRIDSTVHQDPNVLKVKVEGDQVYIKMKDARVVQALGDKSGLGNAGIGPLMKALLGLNRWMAALRTSYNPEFLINNFVKDFGAGLANLSEYEMGGLRREVGSSVMPALAGIRRALRSGDTTSEWAKVHEEYRLHGGHTAFYGIRDLEDTIQRINKAFSADMSGPAGTVKNTIQWLGNFVEDYNLVIENGTRLATYKALRDRYLAMSGDPNNAQNQKRAKEMAAFAAKNLTVNFNMGGEWKNNLNVLYLFYNASLQGSMALLNPLIRSGKMRRAWMSIVGLGVLQDVMMSMLSPEDDDGEKQYDKLDDYIVEHNAVWMDPFGISERGYFKLPLPYMLNSVYNIGRMAAKMARGKATLGEFMSSAGMSFIESTNPLGGMNTFANWVAPSLLDPFIDLTINEKFTGTPIMPAENPFGRSEVRSQRYWNNTNPTYVSIADWMSTLTGRESDYIGGAVEVSPNQIDYAVNFLLGGVGPFLARSAWFAGGAVDPVWREEMSATDIPFVRKVYGSITSKNDQQRYMKGKDQVLRVLDSLKAARKDGDNEGYMEIMRNHPAEYKAAARINTIENARRRVSSQIKKVRDSKNLTEEKKTELIKAYKEKQNMLVGKGNEVLTGID